MAGASSGWRFRRSFTVIPGLKLNFSKNGLSASIGGSPFTINVGGTVLPGRNGRQVQDRG